MSSQEPTPGAKKPKRSRKAATIPAIQWDKDNTLVDKLLTILERREVTQKLFGTAPVDENGNKIKITGDAKTQCFQSIAKELFPDLYQQDPTGMGNRIQSKINNLLSTYRKKAKALKQTGGGVGGDDLEGENEGLYYIPSTGPDHDTVPAARNIWEKLEMQWEFFPRCHKLWATRNTTNPPVTTTGIGPRGRTVIYRKPRDSTSQTSTPVESSATPVFTPTLGPADDPTGAITAEQGRSHYAPSGNPAEDVDLSSDHPDPAIDPNLVDIHSDGGRHSPQASQSSQPPVARSAVASPAPGAPRSFQTPARVPDKENEAPRSQAPRSNSSGSLSGIAAKAASSVSAAPNSSSKMSSFESTVLGIARDGNQKSHERALAKLKLEEQTLQLAKRAQILNEHKQGLISSRKAKKRLAELDGSDADSSDDEDARPTKRARRSSVEWDCENGMLPNDD